MKGVNFNKNLNKKYCESYENLFTFQFLVTYRYIIQLNLHIFFINNIQVSLFFHLYLKI